MFQKRKMPSTSIYIADKCCLIVAFCYGLLVLSPSLAAQSVRIEDTVKDLGNVGFPNFDGIQTLAESPAPSVEALIKELHIIPGRRLLGGQNPFLVEHVLWCIRALRFITGGKDFCGPTSHVFGTSQLEQNRKYWLQFSHGSCLAFFAMWPSRGSTYIAPADAQRKIIQQWKEWLRKDGKEFTYMPLKDPRPEQWYW